MQQREASTLESFLVLLVFATVMLGIAFFFRGVLHIMREYDNDSKKSSFNKENSLDATVKISPPNAYSLARKMAGRYTKRNLKKMQQLSQYLVVKWRRSDGADEYNTSYEFYSALGHSSNRIICHIQCKKGVRKDASK